MKKMLGVAVLMGVFSTQLFAQTITLEDAKKRVVNDNINVSIAYEQYVMAKTQSRVKAYQLLPTISVDMLIYDYQYAILRTLVPEPQRFFEAAAAKDLALAASVNRRIVQKNLLEDLETTLFLHQYHGEMITSFEKEHSILSDIARRSQEAYDLGAITFTEYYRAQRAVVSSRTQSVNGRELYETQAYALKLILQEKNTNDLDIERLEFYNENLDFPQTVEDAMSVAVNNSQEIVQSNHLINAANKQKKGVALSWISWGGVGFDYFSRVSIAKSEIKKIELEKKKTSYEIKNQVAAQYAQIDAHKEKMAFQAKLLEMAVEEYELAQEEESDLLNSYINTRRAELNLMYAEREARRLEYELEVKYIKLKRIIGASMITNEIPRA